MIRFAMLLTWPCTIVRFGEGPLAADCWHGPYMRVSATDDPVACALSALTESTGLTTSGVKPLLRDVYISKGLLRVDLILATTVLAHGVRHPWYREGRAGRWRTNVALCTEVNLHPALEHAVVVWEDLFRRAAARYGI